MVAGPTIDAYAWSKDRSRATLDRFIDRYVNRERSNDRGDEELMLTPLGREATGLSLEEFDWIPVRTLEDILAVGVKKPDRSFVVYLTTRPGTAEGAALGFTVEGDLVLGRSVMAEGADRSDEDLELMRELVGRFQAYRGMVGVDLPPPLSEAEWRAAVASSEGSAPIVLHKWVRDEGRSEG